ncbi:MAG: hypothetical protein JXR42_03615 [Gammaproteobacteria bacterium]|nr:hypothetical protein [Gammaproteobacteria bacterium]
MAELILLFIALLTYFSYLLVSKYRGDRLHTELQMMPNGANGREVELNLLREKINYAVRNLKSSSLGVGYSGRSALYALPWYVVIGAPAVGKSTLLRNSGLSFFDLDGEIKIKGVGGTRNCDWWFADQAVILDTAGRYTTEAEDNLEWLEFLKILKKYRSKMPLNGVVVAVSCDSIQGSSTEDISDHVNIVLKRIYELYNCLGFVFPVTLVITKCDLLSGFLEFFGACSKGDLSQTFGLDLGGDYAAQLDRICREFEDVSLQKMHGLDSVAQKFILYSFPNYFKSFSEKLCLFLDLLLKKQVYQDSPYFTGVYFSSAIGLGSVNKSFFIRELFERVVFLRKNCVSRTKKSLKRYNIFRAFLLLFCLAFVGFSFFAYSTAFSANVLLLRHGESAMRSSLKASTLDSLVSLDSYYSELKKYHSKLPLYLRLGLYRADSELPIIKTTLLVSLNRRFADPLKLYLETKLQEQSHVWTTANTLARSRLRVVNYAVLQAYLSLINPAAISFNDKKILLTFFWNKLSNSVLHDKLLDFYLRNQTELAANNDLVIRVNKQLGDAKKVSNVYAALKSIMLLRAGSLMFANNLHISRFYTQVFYQDVLKPRLNGNKELLRFYRLDCLQAWSSFLQRASKVDLNFKQVLQIYKCLQNSLPNAGLPIDIDSYTKLLIAVQSKVDSILDSHNAYLLALDLLRHSDSDSVFTKALSQVNTFTVALNDESLQQSFRSFLLGPLKLEWKQLLLMAKDYINKRWHKDVYNYYVLYIESDFPFSRASEVDADSARVIDFFKKGGVLDGFSQEYVIPLSKSKWLGMGLDYSDRFLEKLSQIRRLGGMLLDKNGNIKLNYAIYPQPTPGIEEWSLCNDGHCFNYLNGPQHWRHLGWLSLPDGDSYLSALIERGGEPVVRQYYGVWSFLHILNKAKIVDHYANVLRLSWSFKVKDHSYKVYCLLKDSRLFNAMLFNASHLPEKCLG